MKKIYYHKLIRDKVPQKMEAAGATFEVKKLSQKEFEKALIAKLGEEAKEVASARTKQELIEELADVTAVMDEIKKVKKISLAALRAVQKANIKKKGGFAKKLWLVWSEDHAHKSSPRTHA
jgi:predicted house-cleaning noncanonical NTP pyrophosphatase (MazG superfamily)